MEPEPPERASIASAASEGRPPPTPPDQPDPPERRQSSSGSSPSNAGAPDAVSPARRRSGSEVGASQRVSPGASEAEAQAEARQTLLNALDTEFIYYVAALRELSPLLTTHEQRISLEQWVRRLFSPEYCSEALKDRRNRLVCYLATWLGAAVAGGALGGDDLVLPECPQRGPPPMPQDLGPPGYAAAAWETDSQWLRFLKGVPHRVRARCEQHAGGCPAGGPDGGPDGGWELDQELKLLLHLAAPLQRQLGSSGERRVCGQWLRYLCSVSPEDCVGLRARRNQYTRVLLGYLHGGELRGPFTDEPPWGEALPALAALAAAAAGDTSTAGGSEAAAAEAGGDGVDDFMSMQPVPEEGAFCYVVVDGVVPVEFKC